MIENSFKIVVAWHNQDQINRFCKAWQIKFNNLPEYILLQQDREKEGCATTKNKGIANAISQGAEYIIVLDDDCFPDGRPCGIMSYEYKFPEGYHDLIGFAEKHIKSLQPQKVKMFEEVTIPSSRGTPYFNKTIEMPVAASMGFWSNIGDYDAPAQLIHGPTKEMKFKRESIFGKFFPLCGMNLAFRSEWYPWCKFINIPRFDDIWQGFLWQKKAYADGFCFNLNGPVVKHSRQSNVWANLRDEAPNLERNETIWSDIYRMKLEDYDAMVNKLNL